MIYWYRKVNNIVNTSWRKKREQSRSHVSTSDLNGDWQCAGRAAIYRRSETFELFDSVQFNQTSRESTLDENKNPDRWHTSSIGNNPPRFVFCYWSDVSDRAEYTSVCRSKRNSLNLCFWIGFEMDMIAGFTHHATREISVCRSWGRTVKLLLSLASLFQNWLQRLGYLKTSQPNMAALYSAQAVQEAISAMQEQYGLQITGFLDQSTVE